MRLGVERRSLASGGEYPNQARPPVKESRGLGRLRRASPLSPGRLAIKRLTRSWALLLAVGLGMLAAVILICTVPLYDTLIADVQLQRALATNLPPARNIEAKVETDKVSGALRSQIGGQEQVLAQRYLSTFVSPTSTYYVVSNEMLLLRAGQNTFDPASPMPPHVTFEAFDYAATAAHMRLLAGALPQTGGAQPQIIVTKETADEQQLTVGSTMLVTQFGDHSQRLTARVVGIWEPRDALDPYWNGFTFSAHPKSDSPPIYPVLMAPQEFFGALPRFSLVGMTQHWVYYVQPSAITVSNMELVRQNVGRFRSENDGSIQAAPGVGSVTIGGYLDQTIQDVQRQQSLLLLPLYVIVAQVVGLALFFVMAMAGLLVDGQSQDIATLKSRGASGVQLLTSFTLQGVAPALIAVIGGPFIATLISLELLRLFVPVTVLRGIDVNANYLAQVANPRAALAPAVIGALIGLLAVTLSAFQSSRLDVLAFRREQGRSTRSPFWKRYYLDLALVALCVVGYIELAQFGDINTRAQIGGGASPLLLVTPALLLLAGALLTLRILPLGAGLGAKIAARGRGFTSLLAFSQIERSPARYSRITLLLVLAVGLGFFAITFDASLMRNAHDQAAYSVGADVRVTEDQGIGGSAGQQVQARIAHLPGVTSVTPLYRSTSSTSIDLGNLEVDTLGIDPSTFAAVAGPISWRSDYADASLATLMSQMRANQRVSGAGTGTAPLWALVSQQFATQLHLNTGDKFSLLLGESSFVPTTFVVGAIITAFPTLYPNRVDGSFIVVNLHDYFASALTANPAADTSTLGANEFWLRTQHDAAPSQAFFTALSQLQPQSYRLLSDALDAANANPTAAGIRGLLLVGAVTAALLAILGSVIQSLLAARQRVTQFAVLRTLGMTGRQLAGLLLGEQAVMYFFGLVGGAVLGLLLSTATLPFLQFSDTTTVDVTTLGVPPYQLTFNIVGIAIFYVALLVAFALALLLAARYASTVGLGKALRLGED